jgi:hypothetical protein
MLRLHQCFRGAILLIRMRNFEQRAMGVAAGAAVLFLTALLLRDGKPSPDACAAALLPTGAVLEEIPEPCSDFSDSFSRVDQPGSTTNYVFVAPSAEVFWRDQQQTP